MKLVESQFSSPLRKLFYIFLGIIWHMQSKKQFVTYSLAFKLAVALMIMQQSVRALRRPKLAIINHSSVDKGKGGNHSGEKFKSNRCQHFPHMQRSRRQRRCKPRLAQGSEAEEICQRATNWRRLVEVLVKGAREKGKHGPTISSSVGHEVRKECSHQRRTEKMCI